MNIPRQMLNLIGIVVAVGLLVAGVTLIALPMYGSAQKIDLETSTVAQTNGIYEVQVARLAGANEDIDQLTADVSALREQIAPAPHLDDAMVIVVDAAQATDATIETVSAGDPEPWTPRTGLADAEGTGTAPADPAAAPAEGEAAPAEGADAAATTETTEGTDAATGGAETPAAEPEASPQQQIPLTITLTVRDARSAARFVDALGAGPRLLVPIDATLDGETLTVTALALVRTET